ncbi:hypothetical protein BBJ28_00008671 [Nothophytophthora sp. Chile5]|nr:hypothetical protein BBJ28_00008671 [Nothophytophthora sp. Chile5]
MAVRVATPEIRLHCGPTGLNEAVLSLDFLHPREASTAVDAAVSDTEDVGETKAKSLLLATGGADKEIKLWRVGDGDILGTSGLDFVFSLTGHDRSVNCVRFSPNGVFLASASDDTSIILWTKSKTAGPDWRWDQISSLSDVSRTILACGHKGDITDLSWSPDSAFLCSTSVDNRCVIWDVEKGDVAERRKDHTQYVQGAAWDPLNEFLVTEGNDRTCRVYSLSGFGAATRPNGKKQGRKFMCIQTLKTRQFPADPSAASVSSPEKGQEDKEGKSTVKPIGAEESAVRAPAPKHRMFLDDTCPAFARRPAWTPDGSYFLAPTGTFRASELSSPVNTVYAFSRGNLSEPTLHLPGQEKASLGVRCSPLLYELRRQEGDATDSPTHNFFKTQFRSVFAVLTLDAVVIYDTQVLPLLLSPTVLLVLGGRLIYQVALNENKMKRMFATPKKSRKKARTHVVAGEQTPAKVPAVRKKPQVAPPIVRAFQKVDGVAAVAANPINTLQVRKKRKIAPTLVQVVSAPTAGPHVMETGSAAASVPAAATAAASVIDLSESTSIPPAPAQQQPSGSTATHSGTWDDPVDI